MALLKLKRPVWLGGLCAVVLAACAGGPNAPSASSGVVESVVAVETGAIVPASEGHAVIDGRRIYYTDSGGGGPVVVLLHAATGSFESWVHQTPAFVDAGYRVIAYSRRTHFMSDAGVEGETQAQSEDLADLLDQLGVDEAALVATAAGSFVAADFAVSYPERVSRIVLACSLIAPSDPLIMEARAILSSETFRALPPEEKELSGSYRLTDPQGAARWLEIEERARSGPGSSWGPPTNEVQVSDIAATGRPVLLIGGDADLYMPPALLRSVAERLPGSELIIVADAAHSVFWEQPDAFNDAVLAFLRGE